MPKAKKTQKKLIDFLEIKKPFLVDIRLIHKIIHDRIEYYKENGVNKNDIENDLTLANIEEEIKLPSFEKETEEILKKFSELCEIEEKRPKSLSEISGKKIRSTLQKDIEIYVDKYLNIASKYIKTSIYPEVNRKRSKCPNCKSLFEKSENDPNTGILECVVCGYEVQNALFIPSMRDGNYSINASSGYEDRDNFIKKMERKQGKIHSTFHDTLFNELDEIMRKRGCLTGEEVRKMECNALGEKEGTSLEMLITALSDIKCPKYYNDVDYIAHVYWGWTLLDFSSLESSLLEMYDVTQRIYNEIENKERVAALNTEVRLYLQLKSLGYRVSRTRFRFQDSQDSLEFHQSMWRIMCTKAGYTYHSL